MRMSSNRADKQRLTMTRLASSQIGYGLRLSLGLQRLHQFEHWLLGRVAAEQQNPPPVRISSGIVGAFNTAQITGISGLSLQSSERQRPSRGRAMRSYAEGGVRLGTRGGSPGGAWASLAARLIIAPGGRAPRYSIRFRKAER